MDDVELVEARWQVSPRYPSSVTIQDGFDKQVVVLRGRPDIVWFAWQPVFHPLPLIITQGIPSSCHRSFSASAP